MAAAGIAAPAAGTGLLRPRRGRRTGGPRSGAPFGDLGRLLIGLRVLLAGVSLRGHAVADRVGHLLQRADRGLRELPGVPAVLVQADVASRQRAEAVDPVSHEGQQLLMRPGLGLGDHVGELAEQRQHSAPAAALAAVPVRRADDVAVIRERVLGAVQVAGGHGISCWVGTGARARPGRQRLAAVGNWRSARSAASRAASASGSSQNRHDGSSSHTPVRSCQRRPTG